MEEKRKKKPLHKRVWFIILMVFFGFCLLVAIFGNDNEGSKRVKDSPSYSFKDTKQSETETNQGEEKTNEPISYTEVDADTLIKALKENALKASKTYKGQYLSIKGKISNIDSSGAYISIDSLTDDFNLVNIQCFLTSDEQREIVANSATDEVVTVKGKVKDVGEILGYSIEVDEITAE